MQVHLQGVQRCLGCAGLFLLTVVSECVIFLFEGSHIANARVCSQGTLPRCDWELQASCCKGPSVTSLYVAPTRLAVSIRKVQKGTLDEMSERAGT